MMELSQWKKAMQLHVAALETMLKDIFEIEYTVEISETALHSAEETQQELEHAESIFRFKEQKFKSEMVLGFGKSWENGLAESSISADDSSEEMRHGLTFELTKKIVKLITSALDEVGVKVEMNYNEPDEEKRSSEEFTGENYGVSHFRAEPSDGDKNDAIAALDFWVAISGPDEDQLAAYEEKFKKKNPFKDRNYADALSRGATQLDGGQQAGDTTNFGSGINRKGQNVEFEDFGNSGSPNNSSEVRNIDILKNVEMNISVELGRRQMPLGHILKLVKGSVIELEKLAGEPVELLVNGHAIARGDVVVIDEHFGVRISDLMASHEHIKELQ